MSYLRFAAMIATSTVVMFTLMYVNTYAWEHLYWSETRAYMAIVMGATMAIIMLAYMLGMYKNRAVNIAIFAGSVAAFAVALWLVRSQATVGDVSYMRAMIPHHSIAIMTSERAQITDPRVRKLADEIIAAQNREIAEMRYLIADIEGGEAAPEGSGAEEPPAEVGTISQALSEAVVAAMNPAPVPPGEAQEVLAPGPGCSFSRTAESDPILIARAPAEETGQAQGVMKLNGVLVPLEAMQAGGRDSLLAGTVMQAEGVRMVVRRSPEEGEALGGLLQRSNAELVFELEEGLTVGYRGFYTCEA